MAKVIPARHEEDGPRWSTGEFACEELWDYWGAFADGVRAVRNLMAEYANAYAWPGSDPAAYALGMTMARALDIILDSRAYMGQLMEKK